ncbi:MAG TPA: hypothetical protein PKY77_05740 [Phycisphaerae bacterium]|nr:hypothetical protein [Phycisphaerae bacterium]HRY69054.1 hypothetical protein [Phycisphaerae bacterium]HSA25971.1 hypothetical protein [Phycisphaerae bacterium]
MPSKPDIARGDVIAAHRLVGEHIHAMRSRVDEVKVKLARLASECKSLYLDGKWVASVMAGLSVRSPQNMLSTANTTLADSAMLIRSSSVVTSAIAKAEQALYEGSLAIIDRMQRDEYRLDQETRARIYDAVTSGEVAIRAVVTDEELAMLAKLPLEGGDRDEWVGKAATDWADGMRSATVRIVSGAKGGAEQRAVDLAKAVDRHLGTWLNKAYRLAYLAALVAMHASAKVFMAGLVKPSRRADMRRAM